MSQLTIVQYIGFTYYEGASWYYSFHTLSLSAFIVHFWPQNTFHLFWRNLYYIGFEVAEKYVKYFFLLK